MSFSGADPRQRRIVPVTMIPDFGEDGFFIKDDFASGSTGGVVGELGWTTSGGTTSIITGESGHPGIVRRETGATAGTYTAAILQNIAAGPVLPAEMFAALFVFRLGAADADTGMRIGLGASGIVNPPGDGIYLEKLYADTSWFAVTRAASAETRSAALAPVDAAWHRLRIRRIDASTIGFTLDGGTEVMQTTNIPTAATNPFLAVVNQALLNKTLDIDFFSLRITGLSR